MEIPKLNKTYNCFDDGKISESRKYEVTIEKIVPFDEIDEEILEIWKDVSKFSHWLFAKETDFFIFTSGEDGADDDNIFVRTKDNGWFGIGNFFNSGRLDVDGKLTEWLTKQQKENGNN